MWGNHEGMAWWWIFGGVWMVFIWAAIIGLVVWVTKHLSSDRSGGDTATETPMEIAEKRLASGEIDNRQFEELKESLQK